MNIRKFAVVALTAASIVALPVAGQAASAHHASLNKASAIRKNASHLGSSTIIIGLIAGAAIIGGIIAASNGSNSKSP